MHLFFQLLKGIAKATGRGIEFDPNVFQLERHLVVKLDASDANW